MDLGRTRIIDLQNLPDWIMSSPTPLPFAFAKREAFLKLSVEKRTTHLWDAHAFCEAQLGQSRFTDEELHRNLRVLRRMLLGVAKHMAKKFQKLGVWKDSADPRWPRNYHGDDSEHWYKSGAFPPQFLSLPEDPDAWRTILKSDPTSLFDEMIAWVETPAGQAGVGDEELQKLLADRETYLPSESKPSVIESSDEAWEHGEAGRVAGLTWLANRSSDGRLAEWAAKVELAGVLSLLSGVQANRRPIERLLPDLMDLEHSGEWERLQQFLDTESHSDAAALSSLRASLPKRRGL